jgi:hypothetical protein
MQAVSETLLITSVFLDEIFFYITKLSQIKEFFAFDFTV